MPATVSDIRQQRQRIEEQRYEAFLAWEREKLLTDELTDQSERLAAPMENEFEYVLTDRGLAVELKVETERGWDVTYEPVREVLEKGLQRAEEQATLHPEWKFELERRRIEREEWEEIEAFVVGEKDALALIVFSPRPDAKDSVAIDGYGQERAMMRRVVRTKKGVSIKSSSLHQNNYQALQASVEAIGYSLPDGMSSEDRLRQRYWITEQPPAGYDWSDVARRAYDLSLGEQLGGEWYAGRRPMEVTDALAFVKKQPDLIEQHMRAIQEVMRSIQDHAERALQLEHHRYNFAAALDARLHGQEVTSVSEAGETAREEGKEFAPDCPVLNSGEAQLEQQGFAGEVLCTCPFCGKKVKIDPCASQIKCSACTAEVRDGVVISEGTSRQKEQKKQLGAAALTAVEVEEVLERQIVKIGDIARTSTGKKLEVRQAISVGGAQRYWADFETGEIVEKISLN